MKEIIVFNGVHSSGKTSLAELAAKKIPKAQFFPEIGASVRAKTVNYNSLTSYSEYDREIMRKELERDGELLEFPELPIVETWHIGNIAYAQERSPNLIAEYFSTLTAQLKKLDPKVIIISISDETFLKRAQIGITQHDPKGLLRFYRNIESNTLTTLDKLRITPFVVENNGPIEEAENKVYDYLTMSGTF